MSSLTLGQASDALRGLAKVIREHGTCAPMAVEHVADAIDAHIAGMGEPVAEVCSFFELRWAGVDSISSIAERNGIKVGDKLYAAPPIDLAAVREATQDIREWCDMYIGGGNLPPLVENLEAAIKGGA